jgi:hypothetical protein
VAGVSLRRSPFTHLTTTTPYLGTRYIYLLFVSVSLSPAAPVHLAWKFFGGILSKALSVIFNKKAARMASKRVMTPKAIFAPGPRMTSILLTASGYYLLHVPFQTLHNTCSFPVRITPQYHAHQIGMYTSSTRDRDLVTCLASESISGRNSRAQRIHAATPYMQVA